MMLFAVGPESYHLEQRLAVADLGLLALLHPGGVGKSSRLIGKSMRPRGVYRVLATLGGGRGCRRRPEGGRGGLSSRARLEQLRG